MQNSRLDMRGSSSKHAMEAHRDVEAAQDLVLLGRREYSLNADGVHEELHLGAAGETPGPLGTVESLES